MRGIFASCALAAALLAVTWADHHDHHHHHDHHDHHDHHSHSSEGEMSCHKLSSPNADFGFALYKSLNAKAAAGKNIFYSPLGISTALSMLSTGARGETQSQLFSSLGYSGHDQAQINEAYQHLFHMLGHSQEDQQLDVGNAVAVRSGFTPLEKFLKDVKAFYSGESFNVDFTKPVEAAAEINRFIAGKTQDKIKDMVKDLDPEMAMVLINFVYFRGQWEKPFDSNQTHKADFQVDETTKVQVDMMRRMGRYDFYQDADNHTTVIMLPYKGNTSMMIVLPDEGKMAEVEGYINKDYIQNWHDKLFRNSVDLFLPKFSISADASLDDTLKELGMTNAFSDNADFSGMSDEVKLKVSKVSHQAVLSVDETGTEAAAGTTLEVMPMSMPDTMTLNRPFLVFILEHSTKSILFMGKINNPAAM
ncbi:alpha-1-antitrypsin homolog [Seriola lalandi dorsalis]|nr:alpha-1-antitrypsin homolog [Seriola lalandi dorsalis]